MESAGGPSENKVKDAFLGTKDFLLNPDNEKASKLFDTYTRLRLNGSYVVPGIDRSSYVNKKDISIT